MIHELVTPDPKAACLEHWAKVPMLKDRERIAFTPGLNIIIGENGGGKSTLLTTLATLLHCNQGGFQKFTDDSLDRLRLKESTQYVVADNTEVRYHGAHQGVGFYDGHIDYDFGADAIQWHMTKNRLSQGQLGLHQLGRLLSKPARKPGPIESKRPRPSDAVTAAEARIHAPAEPGQPKLTVILDEPERSLDPYNASEVWLFIGGVVASKRAQVIVASHSILALDLEANYIEMSPDYHDKALKKLSEMGWRRNE